MQKNDVDINQTKSEAGISTLKGSIGTFERSLARNDQHLVTYVNHF